MPIETLTAISPVDGRYSRAVEPLRACLSESALIHERIRVEAQWVLHLAGLPAPPIAAAAGLAQPVIDALQRLRGPSHGFPASLHRGQH